MRHAVRDRYGRLLDGDVHGGPSPPSTSGPSPPRRWLLIGAAVAVLAVIVALVVVLTGDDDEPVATSDEPTTTAAPTTTPDEATTTTIDEATSTTAAPTTTSATEPTPSVNGEIVARGDLDGNGSDELFARAPMGAYTDGISVYTLREDGSTVPVTLNGTPAVFPVGASVQHSAGLRCDPQTQSLRVYSGDSDNGETFTVTWRDLQLDNGALTQIGTGNATAQTGDDLYQTAGTFDSTAL